MQEIKYCPIPGFPGYRAGSDGSLWSAWMMQGTGYGGAHGKPYRVISENWHQLKADERKSDGRKRYTLKDANGKYVRKYGSYFVLLAFVGPKPEGMEACHNNGDCTNDAPDGLRWDTPLGNKADMIRHGTTMAGERNCNAILTWERVRSMRRRFAAGGISKSQIARQEGISTALCCMVLNGKIWKERNGEINSSVVNNGTAGGICESGISFPIQNAEHNPPDV